ncbi:unnamed protein product [Alternaria alternata]
MPDANNAITATFYWQENREWSGGLEGNLLYPLPLQSRGKMWYKILCNRLRSMKFGE